MQNLLNIPSPSGMEEKIQAYIESEIGVAGDRDNIGNLVYPGPSGILISAHIDELGLIITQITDDGFIHFMRNSGEDRKCLPGHRFTILTDEGKEIPAVCMKKAIHLETSDERGSVGKVENMVLSVGADNKAGVEALGIQVGDMAVYRREQYTTLGANKICAQGLDDKAGAYVVKEVLKRVGNEKVSAAFCVQEETGLVGAEALCGWMKPEISIDLDVCHSTESSLGINKAVEGDVVLGKGVVIMIGADKDRKLAKDLIKLAKEKEIPYQIAASRRGGTNTDAFQRFGLAKTAHLGIPCQNMHTPVEIVDMRDIKSAIDLLIAYIG